jgi:hypothetical protein
VLEGGKTSEIKAQNYKNLLMQNGALFVDINRYGLSSKAFSTVRVSGEDRASIEKKLFRENVGAINVSIKNLRGEQGSQIAEKLLNVLKVSSKIDETKKDYSSRLMEEAIELLGLKEALS